MYKQLLIVFLCILNSIVFSQESFDIDGIPCPMEGSAKRKNDQALNRLKNRYVLPQQRDFDTRFNWVQLSNTDDDSHKFDEKKATILRGYVLRVRMSAKETCNCNSENPDFRDTHIILTPNKQQKGVLDQVVIEVTPRMRFLMKQKGVDWSQTALKKTRWANY